MVRISVNLQYCHLSKNINHWKENETLLPTFEIHNWRIGTSEMTYKVKQHSITTTPAKI